MRAALLGLIFSAAALQGAAAEPVLALPVDCTLGETCFIQQYVDHDPGPGARDFTCAALSYDGHKGTDFRVPDFADLTPGVAVLAAAPGVVRGVRDGMADGPLTDARRAEAADRECGNGVLIDHGAGWETQYCHLKQGSITVRSGDRLAAGARLGDVGQSGLAEFPHLHLSVRKDGAVVDPFRPDALNTCTPTPPARTLWADQVAYQPGGLLSAGFAAGIPDFAAIRAGTAHLEMLPSSAEALVIWGYLFGTRAGDTLHLTITGPGGQEVHATRVALERTQAEAFRASGRRLRADAWPEGTYTGRVEVRRDGAVIDTVSTTVTVR